MSSRDEKIRYMNLNVDLQAQQVCAFLPLSFAALPNVPILQVRDIQQQLATKEQQIDAMQASIKGLALSHFSCSY